MQFSIIYPAYNEAQSIQSAVTRTIEALRPLFDRFEILIVNDASRDSTGDIAEELAQRYPEVRVLHNETNQGQGGSLIVGFRAARGELLLHNGVDYPFDMRDLARLVPLIQNADIVVAARRRRSGYTAYRKVISIANVALLHLLFELRLRDYNFIQLYRRRVWDEIPVEASSTGFLIPSMLIRAHDRGFRITEMDVDYHPREKGVATSGQFKVVLSSIRELFAFWWQRRQAMNRPGTRNGLP
jgi:glycosyltransferase involved in cell wall biosynthesis